MFGVLADLRNEVEALRNQRQVLTAMLRTLVDGYEMAGDEFYSVVCDYCSLQSLDRDAPHDYDCPWLAAKRYLEGQDA